VITELAPDLPSQVLNFLWKNSYISRLLYRSRCFLDILTRPQGPQKRGVLPAFATSVIVILAILGLMIFVEIPHHAIPAVGPTGDL
jgi:hypothetical protein